MLIKGTFTFDADTLILIPAQAGDEAFFAARQLQDEICQVTCLTMRIVKAYAPPRPANVILLVCAGRSRQPPLTWNRSLSARRRPWPLYILSLSKSSLTL